MEQITLRVPEDVLEDVDEDAENANQSRSEYLRDVISSRNEHGEEAERLRTEVEELRTEVERLRNEKREILKQREENQELVKWADQERSLQEEKLHAGVVTRARWFLLGKDDER